MRVLISAIALSVALATTGSAQTPSTEKAYPLGLSRLLDGITLTTRQRASVDSVADAYWAKMNAMRPVLDGETMEIKQKAAADQRAKLVADVEKFLTKEQLAALHKNMAAAKR